MTVGHLKLLRGVGGRVRAVRPQRTRVVAHPWIPAAFYIFVALTLWLITSVA